MLLGDLARAVLVGLIPLLHWLDALGFPVLLGIAFGIGVFSAPYYSSQRLILPELLGEDERSVSQANSLVDGAVRATSLLGPAVAGVLIGWLSAVHVLWIDAATFLCSFVILAVVVSGSAVREPRAGPGMEGVLAGVRFLMRERLLGGMTTAILIFGFVFPILLAALPVLAFTRHGESARVAGILFASWGAGMVIGSVAAFKAVERFELPRLAGTAVVCAMAVLWLLVLELPIAAVAAVLLVSGFWIPLLNAPLATLLTIRTPKQLRPKVMTATVTAENLAGPLGYTVAGPMLELVGLQATFALIAVGGSLSAATFLIAVRGA
jgi:MFS family permease